MNRQGHVLGCITALFVAAGASAQPIGETPAIPFHMNQAFIDKGQIGLRDLFDHGKTLFEARFNALDGQGRPATTGGGAPRVPDEPFMIRTSGPDSTSCIGCHSQPRSGGAGDFVANVFVLAQTLDPVTFSVSPQFSDERNTLGMMGSGPIEMLAREMTAELRTIRAQAILKAAKTGHPVTAPLSAKGVDFGRLTALPDGRIDPTEIEGVDWDLIVKPFHQKGAVVSLREFTNNAMNHHHGIQSVERFGFGDPDQDGVPNELSVGDVTATVIYQAALNTPGRVMPKDQKRIKAVNRGEQVFQAVGCTSCHVPLMTLKSPYFTEPNPYNPIGNLQVKDVPKVFTFDMTRDGEKPRLDHLHDGKIAVRAFTDLKRHDLCDDQINHFANEQISQGKLNGTEPESDFTIPAPPRPTRQFLTRKLWDVGNTGPYGHRGDLSTMTEAIDAHGGEGRDSRDAFFSAPDYDQACVIEYLKTFQIVPPEGKP